MVGWRTLLGVAVLLVLGSAWAQEPTVSNVTFVQAPNGALGSKADIYYNLASPGGNCTISATLSKDNGATFPFPVVSASGDFGPGVAPGAGKHIVWDISTDCPDEYVGQAVIQVTASGPDLGGPYPIGYTTIVYSDPTRGGRGITAQIYYPSTTGGQDSPVAGGGNVKFPVVVFGHGWLVTVNHYPYIWQGLAPSGYFVVLCDTETGTFPDVGDFVRDLAFLVDRFQVEGADAGSRFYQKVASATAIMGHSMGGGGAIMALQYSSNITTIVPLAAADLNPSAIEASPYVTVPVLMLSGTADCVAPPEDHQIPMYSVMPSTCKYFVSIIDGSHCGFADDSSACENAEDLLCGGRYFIAAGTQWALTMGASKPWLDIKLKGLDAGRDQFLQYLAANAASGAIAYSGGCTFGNRAESSAGVLDTTRPTVTSVVVQTERSIQVSFSRPMLEASVTNPANYTISADVGTLSPNPSSVAGAGPCTLNWNTGEMLDGGVITVTASPVQDTLGNRIGLPGSGSGTGMGTPPTGTIGVLGAVTPGYTNTVIVDLGPSATDASGIAKMRFSNDGVNWTPSNWGAAPAYATSYSGWTLTSGDGVKTVYAQYQDNAGNVSTIPISGNILMDTDPPRADAILPLTPSPTNSATVEFQPVFSEIVQDFDEAADVVVGLTGTLTCSAVAISGVAPNYNVRVQGLAGDGMVFLSVNSASNVRDLAGNLLASSAVSPMIIVEHVPPTVSSIVPITPSPTNADTVSFAVAFSEDVRGLDHVGDVIVSTTEAAGWTGVSIAGGPQDYQVNVTGVTGDGAIALALNTASDVRDYAGNLLTTSPTSAGIAVDHTPPHATMTLDDPNPCESDTVHFSVDFDEAVGTTFSDADAAVIGMLTGSAVVSGTDPNYTVTVYVDNPTAEGTVGVLLGTSIQDAAGNAYLGGFSPLYTIVHWPGFTNEPHDARCYTGGANTFSAAVAWGWIPPVYRWKWDDGVNGVRNGPFGPTWTLGNLSPANRGEYWCDVTYNGVVHASAHALLSVEDHLHITVPPAGAAKTVGESHLFAVATAGGYAPLTYLWKKDGTPIPGVTDASYSISALAQSDSGTYTVDVADSNTDLCSASAELTVSEHMPIAGPASAAFLATILLLAGARYASFRQRP